MKVDYAATISGVDGSYVGPSYTIIKHDSEIICHNKEDREKLANEILTTYKEKTESFIPGYNTYLVQNIMPTYSFVKDNPKLVEESKKLWDEALNSKEERIFMLKEGYKMVLDNIKTLNKDVKELEQEDSQEYLNFLDELNAISVSH